MSKLSTLTKCQHLNGEKMNSFSYDLKNEVASIEPNGQDEAISELSAIIKTSGEIQRNGKTIKIIVKTELDSVCKRVNQILQMSYGVVAQKKLTEETIFSKKKFQLDFPMQITQQVLLDTEIMSFDEDNYMQFSQQISKYLTQEQNLAKAYIRGVFVGCFSCNINLTGEKADRKTTGYHAEFVFSNQTYAQSFGLLLADFDILSKTIQRANSFVVYIKDLDMVSDLLVLCGATRGVLALQNESAMRSIRNNVNRQTNCTTSNLTKTVDASIKQMDAIDTIRETVGIESLDENLKQAIYLRIANPEESLDNLSKLSDPKVSKSGLYHRFQKIVKIATELKR